MSYASPTLMEGSERCVATKYLAGLRYAVMTNSATLTKRFIVKCPKAAG
jgi:hypothetical protein